MVGDCLIQSMLNLFPAVSLNKVLQVLSTWPRCINGLEAAQSQLPNPSKEIACVV
jgi:hypothetical protein